MLLNIKFVFGFLCKIFPETFFHSKKNSARYHKRTWDFMDSTRYSCQIFMWLKFSRQIFEKKNPKKKTNFMKNCAVRADSFFSPMRTDRRTDTWRSWTTFRNFANVSKIQDLRKSRCIMDQATESDNGHNLSKVFSYSSPRYLVSAEHGTSNW